MHSLILQIIFYGFAALAVLSALMVITQNNPVRCVLFLVLTFFASSVLWIILEAEFLALILVLVYVGAVMTLFLFVVMMLNIDTESIKTHLLKYFPLILVVTALFIGLLLVAIPKGSFTTAVEKVSTLENYQVTNSETYVQPIAPLSNTEAIGLVLYTDYLLAFEIAAVLLLVAIVSAITLAHREVMRSKRQDIVKQIMTSRHERLELVNMKSEK